MRLCFLTVVAAGRAGSRGAALVTDAETVPVEFRVTDPIRAEPAHRVLYGAALDHHLLVDLIGVPLLRALREEVSHVLVREPRLLRLQERASVPVLWVGREDDLVPMPDADEPGFLLAGPAAPPVVVLGYRGRHEETRAAGEVLQRVLARHDVLEPFGRLDTALAQLAAAPASRDLP